MPHECLNCGYVFDDGSREMLDGCPDCGGSKFLFTKTKPESKPRAEPESKSEIIEATNEQNTPRRFGGTFVKGEPEAEVGEPPATQEPGNEIEAAETPDPEELRQELEERFESIKILEPGTYELNLMNLYDKEEKIIALQEDGRYQVSLPSAMKGERGP